MSKKVLIVATVQSHIAQFHKPLIKMLKDKGCEIHVAARNNLAEKNGLSLPDVDKVYDLPFSRSPASFDNVKVYKQLKKIINSENYDVVHCNTPVGGVVARLAARKARRKSCKVIYTAHGFHFYKGAPLKNWLLYYPVEKLLARITDKVVTINQEDYELAQSRFKTQVCRIHGVGVDDKRFYPISEEEKKQKRIRMGFEENQKILLCVGELLPNKNQIMAIKTVERIKQDFPNILLLLAGNGRLKEELEAYVTTHKLQSNVKFVGYVTNLEEYQQISDISVSCSKREGLPLNIVEAMLAENPIIATKNRGHCELVIDGENGFLVEMDDINTMQNKMTALLKDSRLSIKMGQAGKTQVQKYTTVNVEKEIDKIYADM